MRWRKIAARLPGRSDDAVRNRWKRLSAEAAGQASAVADALGIPSPPLPEGMSPLDGDSTDAQVTGGAAPKRAAAVSLSHLDDMDDGL